MYKIVIPMLAKKTNGIIKLSMNSIIAATASTTAIATYSVSSRSHRSRRSVIIAEIPETRQLSPAIERICVIASIVSSDELEESKNTAIRVSSPALNTS